MQIESYEKACEVLKLNPDAELPFKGKKLTPRQRRSNSHTKLMIINEAMHLDVKGPRYFFPLFAVTYKTKPGDFGFVGPQCVDRSTDTLVSTSIRYANIQLAAYAAETHEEIYREFFGYGPAL